MPYIRLLGAAGTGKTQLAAELRVALRVGVEEHPALPDLGSPAPATAATLLMGLDLPCPPAARPAQQAADQELRGALARAGIAYQVVYGQGADRLCHALQALQAWPSGAGTVPAKKPGKATATWVWACDNCSDPQCERRLLSDLLAARSSTAP